MKNTDLKQRYDTMHKTGKSAWFDDGAEERQAIVKMGMPWQGKTVMEIGCGEADLLDMISEKHAITSGIDYSLEAITTAKNRRPYLDVMCCDWEEYPKSRYDPDVLVMQGVLEHMDDWQAALDGMIAKFKPKTIITSMPCFLNPRGIVWMALNLVGAVMSKTDLHYIDPWDVQDYCTKRDYGIMQWDTIDRDWGGRVKMLDDLTTRLPLAIKDGNLPWDALKFGKFMIWLERLQLSQQEYEGAVAIYRIDL